MAARKPVAVIGAGLIGRAWAIVFARAGHPVQLFDQDAGAAQAALAFIAARLDDLRAHQLIEELPSLVLERIRVADNLGEAVRDACLVQENVRETPEAKRQIFAQLDMLAPADAVLASSTSWLPASVFTEHLDGRARCLVAHPTNPPYLVPLVELCPAPWTSGETMALAHALYQDAGQEPVSLSREIHGFLLNRVQGAVLNECFSLYQQGLASAQDIDKVLKHGLALRWSFMGPFETIDLNAPGGVTDYAQRYGAQNQQLAESMQAFDWNESTLRQLDGERRAQLSLAAIDARAAWRDRRLMALAAHQRLAPKN